MTIVKKNYSMNNLPTGCTEERAEELKQWAFKVWNLHWIEFAPVSNSRAQFFHYVLRDFNIITEKTMIEFENSVVAFTKHLKMKKKAGDKLIGVKTLSVWYNQGCYEDEFINESQVNLRERANAETEIRTCTVDGCNSPVHGSLFSFCSFHLPHDADRLTKAWKETGLNIRSPTFRQDCIDYCKQRGFFR